MIDYITKVDFPKIPKHIEDECILACSKQPLFTLRIEKYIPRGQCLFSVYNPPKVLREWMKSVGIEESEVYIQKMYDGNCVFPHIDTGSDEHKGRSYAINYVLTDDSPVTSWYNQDYEKEFSYRIPNREWYKLNTSVLHGVENITSYRIAISISL